LDTFAKSHRPKPAIKIALMVVFSGCLTFEQWRPPRAPRVSLLRGTKWPSWSVNRLKDSYSYWVTLGVIPK
jgi:hypothetical protein